MLTTQASARPRRGTWWILVAAFMAAMLAAYLTTTVASRDSAKAAESSPIGWASQNGGTTGGAGGSTVTVTSASALDSALQSSSPLIIRVSGMISLTGMHKVASNKSVLGVGSNSGITGGGLNLSGVSNVIIRNLVFRNADDDSINLQNGTHNVWIDHNDLASGHDGLTDIKRGSDFVTVSWNHYHNHDKTALLGHDDGNAAQDRGHLRVTYHHNWFDATTQRHPRVRFGNPVHVYNNYYVRNSGYGVASTIEGGVLVEGNYFESVEDPYHLGEGSSSPGSLVARNNVLVNSGSGQTGGSVRAIPYSYTLDTPSNVKSIVTSGAGGVEAGAEPGRLVGVGGAAAGAVAAAVAGLGAAGGLAGGGSVAVAHPLAQRLGLGSIRGCEGRWWSWAASKWPALTHVDATRPWQRYR
jgi:pectate lyase